MDRPLRVDIGRYVYYALNRASARATVFAGPIDYQQFEQVMAEARVRTGVCILPEAVGTGPWLAKMVRRFDVGSTLLPRAPEAGEWFLTPFW